MKVAYIAPIAENSGYSKAAIGYIRSLLSVGVDVTYRDLPMTPKKGELPEDILECSKGTLENVDCIVQHNLPSEFLPKAKVQNIGLFAYETNHFKNTNWKFHLKLMDKIVVPCHTNMNCVINTDKALQDKTYILPHALDSEKFTKEYKKLDLPFTDNTYKFYTIGEFNRRKNYPALITAYLCAFDSYDDVALIIKTNNNLKSMIEDIRSGLRRFSTPDRYAKILVISDYLSDLDIDRIHYTCDCFVSSSFAESFCIPAAEALCFGKRSILPLSSSFRDFSFLTSDFVSCRRKPVFGVENCPKGLYTGDEVWNDVNIDDLAKMFKHRYINRKIPGYTESQLKEIRDEYSYKTIGNKFKEIISATKS